MKDVEWGEFRIGELFEKIKTKKLPFKADELPKKTMDKYTLPCLTSSFQNQGLNYFVPRDGATILKNVISIPSNSDVYRAYFQSNEFTILSDAYAIQWIFNEVELSPNQYLFAVQCINKVTDLSIYSYKNKLGGWNIVKDKYIQLPTKNKKIHFDFMENFIAQLEAQKIAELENYLSVSGLKDVVLTAEEKRVLEVFERGEIEWNEFKIDDLFEKLQLKTLKKPFDKLKDTSPIPTNEFTLPLVNAKFGNNGIMFYGREKDFDSAEMTIDIISNGAIATGTVYAQPHKTAVLWDAYLLKMKIPDITKSKLLYFTTSLEKSIKTKFGWDNKAVWSKVQKEIISLPTKNNQPNYQLMETLISAVQKLVVRDVVGYVESKGAKIS